MMERYVQETKFKEFEITGFQGESTCRTECWISKDKSIFDRI